MQYYSTIFVKSFVGDGWIDQMNTQLVLFKNACKLSQQKNIGKYVTFL